MRSNIIGDRREVLMAGLRRALEMKRDHPERAEYYHGCARRAFRRLAELGGAA